jgi:hypothetical protein
MADHWKYFGGGDEYSMHQTIHHTPQQPFLSHKNITGIYDS